MSIKQLEEDPLLETLEKVIPQVQLMVFISSSFFIFQHNAYLTEIIANHLQDGSAGSSLDNTPDYLIEPLPGLETIIEELQREDGYNEIYDLLTILLNLHNLWFLTYWFTKPA